MCSIAAMRHDDFMAAKTGIASLPKADQRIARSEMGKKTRKLREEYRMETVVNAGVSIASSAGAAFVDHRFRKGTEGEARLEFGERFRPQVNGVIGFVALGVGMSGVLGRASGGAMAVGTGFGGPAVYAFTRNQLARA